jgi:hypothetical protein
MQNKTIQTEVRIPSYWQKWGINDITIKVKASINDDGDEVRVAVKEVTFPNWHSNNILSSYEFELIELVEQKCIDAYVNQMDFAGLYETQSV